MKETQRIHYVDVTRAIAIVAVTFNHSVNRSFSVYYGSQAEFETIPLILSVLKTVLYIFSRLGVPLFLAISGALLLPRDYNKNIWRFLKHNWLQLLITTELWLAIMFWYLQLAPNSVLFTEGISQCLVRFFMTLLFVEPITFGSMWYMPMILCVYLMIPILGEAMKRIPKKYFILPLSLVVVSSFLIPDLNALAYGLGKDYALETTLSSNNLFSMYLVYVCLGFFIHNGLLSRIRTRTVLCFAVLSFTVSCGFQFWLFAKSESILSYSSLLLMLTSAFLFESLRRIVPNKGKFVLVIKHLADVSFGIYFVHICIMEGLDFLMNRYFSGLRYMSRFFILETVSFLGSVILIQVFRQNRWFAKNLFGIKQLPPSSSIHELAG